jgi:hypothetical protein
VEPHEEMRAILCQNHLKIMTVMDGTTEKTTSVPGGWADAVTVAQVIKKEIKAIITWL